MLPNMRNVAAVIADDAREQGGVDVQQATPRLAREKLLSRAISRIAKHRTLAD
jgi:hypothetical protein